MVPHWVLPDGQLETQAPLSHLLLPVGPHPELQALQFEPLLFRFLHPSVHELIPGAQTEVQDALGQVCPDGQAVEQLPQNWGSVWSLTQALPPLAGVHGSGVPERQEIPQELLLQTAEPVEVPETGAGQTIVQLPQWLTSFVKLTQALGLVHLFG